MPFAEPETALGTQARDKAGPEVVAKQKRAPGTLSEGVLPRISLRYCINDLRPISTTCTKLQQLAGGARTSVSLCPWDWALTADSWETRETQRQSRRWPFSPMAYCGVGV